MHTPDEAVAELEYAVERPRLQVGAVRRVRAAAVRRGGRRPTPQLARWATWLDQFGIDSAYDYDPVWATAQELGVSIAFHSGFIGMSPRRSISSYMYNHLWMLAEGQQSLAKSLFLGGVTRRFPSMNFAFLEGGRRVGGRARTATSSATGRSATSPRCARTSIPRSSTAT